MTKKELSQYRYLKREIDYLNKQIESFTVCDTVKASAKRAPYALHAVSVEGLPISKAYLLSELRKRRRKCAREYYKLCRFLEGIEDSMTRQIFEYRFVCGMSWQQIANRLGNNTEDSVRKLVNRYLMKK